MDNYSLYLKEHSQYIVMLMVFMIVLPVIFLALVLNFEVIQKTSDVNIILISRLGAVSLTSFPFFLFMFIREVVFYVEYRKNKPITEIVTMDGIPIWKKSLGSKEQIIYQIAAKKLNGKRVYFLIYNPKLVGYEKGALTISYKDFIDAEYKITYHKYSNVVENLVRIDDIENKSKKK